MSHWNVQPHVSINEVATLQLRPTFHYGVVIYMCGSFGLGFKYKTSYRMQQHAERRPDRKTRRVVRGSDIGRVDQCTNTAVN